MRYEQLEMFSDSEIDEMLEQKDFEKLRKLPLSVGEYHENFEKAQSICFKLLKDSNDEEIRANATLGLSYIARRFGKLDEEAMCLIKRELKINKAWNGRVNDAWEDIEIFTKKPRA